MGRGEQAVRTIWKYEIPDRPKFTLEMPGQPTFLTVQMQDQRRILWAIVDAGAPMKTHKFQMFETSAGIPLDMVTSLKYIGTLQDSPIHVWHVFSLT